jgi:hypothetical protein
VEVVREEEAEVEEEEEMVDETVHERIERELNELEEKENTGVKFLIALQGMRLGASPPFCLFSCHHTDLPLTSQCSERSILVAPFDSLLTSLRRCFPSFCNLLSHSLFLQLEPVA